MTTTPRSPQLCAGDHLTRDEFERRYAAMPELKKAELIEGVVYMGSPVSHVRHGGPERYLSSWLTYYEERTPGLVASHNATVRLDLDNEPQPDLVLCIPTTAGGQTTLNRGGYFEGPPELVIEVSASSVSYDLHEKKNVYRRNGVREYLVHRVDDREIDWFQLGGGVYVRQAESTHGVLRSAVYPGLWLDTAALLRGDLAALRAAVQDGCAGAEHAAFVQRLR